MSRRRGAQPLFQTKEDTNFKEALKLYEAKQYKKALKLIDTNLKKKNHPESLALKGLLLYNVHASNGKNEDPEHHEAKSYFQKALKENETHPIINHIIAIFYRALPDFAEAAKYYKLALDNGSENKNILKDLAITESQLRRYSALASSRSEVLNAFPGYRANWTGLAAAHHLTGNYELAEKTLTRFEELAEGKLSEPEFFEHSECLLYKNKIIFESGDVKRALAHLDEIEPHTLDKLSVEESRAIYQSLLGNDKAAALTYRKLLKRNPDKTEYYYLLEAALGISSSNIQKRLRLYNKLEKFYPKSDPPKIIPLVFLKAGSEEFEQKLNAYLIAKLKRGVPSVFNALSFLYNNKGKVKIAEKLVFEFLKQITKKSEEKVEPTVVVWTLYFISQHFLKLGDLTKADEYINKAINHSPTLVELYLLKANITKHKGQHKEASEIVNSARLMDLQDRFINSKSVKYYLRANNPDAAIEVASLFTKNDNAVNGLKDLCLMQANWFFIEVAEAYFRLFKEAQKKLIFRLATLEKEEAELSPEVLRSIKEEIDLVSKYKGLTLKRFNVIINNYKDFENDQLDFHSYCFRKGTPRAYIDMLLWADKLYDQPLFLRAVKGISEIYFEVNNELTVGEPSLIQKYNNLAVNKKNNKNKNKNKFNKKREEEAVKLTAKENDDDVYGSKLISTETPIDKLNDVFSLIKDKRSVFYLKLAFTVYLLQDRFLLAFQLLKNSKDLIAESSLLSNSLIRLAEVCKANTNAKLKVIKTMVLKSITATFPDFDPENLSSSLKKLSKQVKFEKDELENNYLYLKSLKKVDEEAFDRKLESLSVGILASSQAAFDKSLKTNDFIILEDYVDLKGSEDYYWI